MGKRSFPQDAVGTAAYDGWLAIEADRRRTRYYNRPPAKRNNYARLGVPCPFWPDWAGLVQGASEGGGAVTDDALAPQLVPPVRPKEQTAKGASAAAAGAEEDVDMAPAAEEETAAAATAAAAAAAASSAAATTSAALHVRPTTGLAVVHTAGEMAPYRTLLQRLVAADGPAKKTLLDPLAQDHTLLPVVRLVGMDLSVSGPLSFWRRRDAVV